MIIEWIVQALAAVFGGLLSLFPTISVPSWVSSSDSMFADLIGTSASMGVWIPWSLMLTVLAAIMSCLVAGFTIKVVRIIASFLTAGGGSAS